VSEIARAFQRGIAQGLCNAIEALCEAKETDTVVLSGGVFQNELLLDDMKSLLLPMHLRVWTNHAVPANDGGISLGQAALAAIHRV
jgi:hydrogenase maturation protein HypF